MEKHFFKLIYHPRIGRLGTPMMDVDSIPELIDLHDEIDSIVKNEEYYDEIVDTLHKVLTGEKMGYSFGYEVYAFECDKDECEVFDWDYSSIGLFRTQDVYDMLKEFQQYRDDFYAHRDSAAQ